MTDEHSSKEDSSNINSSNINMDARLDALLATPPRVSLPTNFSELVLQKVIRTRIELARRQASRQNVWVAFGLLSLLLVAGLLCSLAGWHPLQMLWSLSESGAFLLPLCLIGLGLLGLDRGFSRLFTTG